MGITLNFDIYICLDVDSTFEHCMGSRMGLFVGPKVDMIYYITVFRLLTDFVCLYTYEF
jgi:hypothetical protein